MSKKLVAYFSASGVTAQVAKELAEAAGADLFEIKPVVPYTKEDLDWMNDQSRSSVEMKNKSFRPPVAEKLANMAYYDVVFVGFPIWWYVAPTIVNTFLESYDFAGKTVVPFGTAGSCEMGETNAALAPSCPGAKLLEGKVLKKGGSSIAAADWLKTLEL